MTKSAQISDVQIHTVYVKLHTNMNNAYFYIHIETIYRHKINWKNKIDKMVDS